VVVLSRWCQPPKQIAALSNPWPKSLNISEMIVLELDPAVGDRIRCAAMRTGLPFETVANKALRLGINKLVGEPSELRYVTTPRPMGLKPGLFYESVDALWEDI
jgi:hypothetical protein